jgi:endoglucanase
MVRKLLLLLSLAPALAGAFVVSPGIAVSPKSDIPAIAAQGFNLVRIPFEVEPDPHTVKLAVSRGLKVVLDYHPPQSVIADPFAVYGLPSKWAAWAKAFSGYSPDDVAFEIVNEPRMGKRVKAYDAVLAASIEAIREVSPNRWIVISNPQMSDPDWHDGPLLKWTAPDYPRLIATMHYYRPYNVTHSAASPVAVGGGSAFDQKDWSNRDIHFQKFVNWCRENSVAPWIGEAGCWETVPGRVGWFRSVADIADSLGVPVCWWRDYDRFGIHPNQKDRAEVLKIMLGK